MIAESGQVAFPAGGGQAGAAIRAHDWSASPLGPAEHWSASLRAALNLMLDSPESLYLVWGPDLTFFFNDAYRPILGPRGENALGRPLPVLWADAWEAVRAPLERALAGRASRFADVPIAMARRGVPEETWWSYSFSPLRDDAGRIAGAVCFTRETTADVLTRQRQAAALDELRESEARHAGALAIARLGTFEWVLESGAVALDRRAREIFDLAEGVTVQEVFDRIHPEDLPRVHAETVACAAKAASMEIDYRVRLHGGETRTVSSRGAFLLGADGRAERAVGVFFDTTERVRAERILHASEERYRTLFESLDVGFCIIEMKFDETGRAIDYRIAEANPAFARQTGMDVAGRWVSEFAPNLERHWFDRYGRVALTGEPAHFENGAEVFGRWFEVRALRVGDPGARRVAIFFSDISARRRAEEELRRLNETLEAQVAERTRERNQIWQVCQDMLGVADAGGVWQRVNPAWSRLLGWDEAEFVGRTSEWIEHPDDKARTRAEVSKLAAGEITLSFENRFRARDGTYRALAWTAVPVEGSLYCSARDVTEERARAAALLEAEEALRQSQKMEAVGQLTGGLAHDFNNLLAGIAGSLELMQARMQQGRFQDVERYMSAAQGAAKRAAALTHRLLAFSRRQTLDPKPTDVNRLVAGMQEMIQRTVGPAIAVEVAGDPGLWPVLVDPSQLENALLNLCINARDAMPEGGRIAIETANTWLDAQGALRHDLPEGPYLSLAVTDTGTGMSPEVIARVFEPFFTTKPIGEGTGLGLSMIYGFAQQSGGQVRIHSEVGRGTSVSIVLPRHHGAIADENPAGGPAALPRSEQDATVLVVDDEPTVRMLVTDILEDIGYTAIEAGDSAAGLKVLLSDARIDLLVTDVGLPGGMNGRQMADAARAARPELQVLFVTGYAETAVFGRGQLAPGMAVLTKPFSVETMAARIRSMIEAGREAGRLRSAVPPPGSRGPLTGTAARRSS